jgi:putative membrane protein
MSTLLAFLHDLAAFILVASLTVEFVSLRRPPNVQAMRQTLVAASVFSVAAAAVVVVGLLRVFYFEKGPGYYWSSHASLTKLGVFILVGFLSIAPTVEFLSWRRAFQARRLPEIKPRKLRTIRRLIGLELAGIVFILLMAAIMAHGGSV